MTEGGRTVLALFVTAAAASDLRRGRIYNFLTFPTLAAGFWLLAVKAPEEVPAVLGTMTATLLLLFPFWKAGGLGAGDIKLLAALAPLMGPGFPGPFILLCLSASASCSACFSSSLECRAHPFL